MGSPRVFGLVSIMFCVACHVNWPFVSHKLCVWIYLCRAEDYWVGYKFFCFDYYSHSLQHQHEFRECKLRSSMAACFDFEGVLGFCLPPSYARMYTGSVGILRVQ